MIAEYVIGAALLAGTLSSVADGAGAALLGPGPDGSAVAGTRSKPGLAERRRPPRTLHVDKRRPTCSDREGAGTSTRPFCTIDAAASAASPGVTVLVSSGTYNEQVSPRSGARNAPVVIAPAPRARVTVTGRSYGFDVTGKSWVTIRGFNVVNTGKDGIHVFRSSHIALVSNAVSHSGRPVAGKTGRGIFFGRTSDSRIEHNSVDHNTDFGIFLTSCSGDRVIANTSFANAREFERAASGLRFYASSNNMVESNIAYGNEDSGLEFGAGSNDNLILDNISYANGDHGIDNNASSGQKVVSNTVYRNVTSGINAEAGSTGLLLANNISVDNGHDSPRTKGDIRIDAASVSGSTMDYDLVDVPLSDVLITWRGIPYRTLKAFTAATGQEVHGIEADPKWVAPATGNFELQPGSPAIDSADSAVGVETSRDARGAPRVDDPKTPNVGAGPRPFDDRGALEYQADARGSRASRCLAATTALRAALRLGAFCHDV